jgi:hypothetical protein
MLLAKISVNLIEICQLPAVCFKKVLEIMGSARHHVSPPPKKYGCFDYFLFSGV